MISYFEKKSKLSVCEDSLTASVFDGLKHLPAEMFWRILKRSLYRDKLPRSCGDLRSVLFWERWSSKDDDDIANKEFVEPDVFIRFEKADIIVEAKRRNEKQQKEEQLVNEVRAYRNEFPQDDKPVYFLQLGGLQNTLDTANYTEEGRRLDVVVCKTDWTSLLGAVVGENMRLKSSDLSASTRAYIRILDDIVKGLELHRYYKKDWLADFQVRSGYIDYYSVKMFDYAKHR